MEYQSQETRGESKHSIPIHWAESEWFEVWLQLGRHIDPDDRQKQTSVPDAELVPAG